MVVRHFFLSLFHNQHIFVITYLVVLCCFRHTLCSSTASTEPSSKKSVSLLRRYEAHLVQGKTREVYYIQNLKKRLIWDMQTLIALHLETSDIHHIPQWLCDSFEVGDKIDVSDKDSFSLFSQSFNASYSKGRIEIPLNYMVNLNKTLVVIYGQYRTFDYTCPSIFEHIVRQNMPCTVVMVIDESKEREFTPFAQHCMQPYRHLVTIIQEKFLYNPGLEFDLMQRALDHVASKNLTFDYIIKVRTDNYVKADFPVSEIYGTHANFFYRFLRFEYHLTQEYGARLQRKPSYHETLWAWIFTGGVAQFIRPMIFEPSDSPWSFINSTTWNQDVKDYIFSMPDWKRTNSYWSYFEVVVQAVQDVHARFTIAYLVGNTWIHFGKADVMTKISAGVKNHFGQLLWNVSSSQPDDNQLPKGYKWPVTSWPSERMRIRYDPTASQGSHQWKEFTESQLRLEHWQQSVNLVDIVNLHDYYKSFDFLGVPDKNSVIEDIDNPDIVVWLMRECSRHRMRKECDSGEEEKFWRNKLRH